MCFSNFPILPVCLHPTRTAGGVVPLPSSWCVLHTRGKSIQQISTPFSICDSYFTILYPPTLQPSLPSPPYIPTYTHSLTHSISLFESPKQKYVTMNCIQNITWGGAEEQRDATAEKIGRGETSRQTEVPVSCPYTLSRIMESTWFNHSSSCPLPPLETTTQWL